MDAELAPHRQLWHTNRRTAPVGLRLCNWHGLAKSYTAVPSDMVGRIAGPGLNHSSRELAFGVTEMFADLGLLMEFSVAEHTLFDYASKVVGAYREVAGPAKAGRAPIGP